MPAAVVSPDFPSDRTAFAGLQERCVRRSTHGSRNWDEPTPDVETSGWALADVEVSPASALGRTLVVVTDI